MSLVNKIVCHICRKQKTSYDPDHPYDYPSRREHERKQARSPSLPKGLTDSVMEKEGYSYHLVRKESNPKDRIVYYIHGGGFVTGSVETRLSFVYYVADKLGYDVAAINYPLSPENPYPSGLNACVDCYKELLKDYSSGKIALVGESAGGNLVLATLLRIKNENLPYPSIAFAFSPCVQYDEPLESYTKNWDTEAMVTNLGTEVLDTYLQKNASLFKDPYVAPLYGDFTGLCPIHLYASDSEYLYDDSRRMYEKLQQDGVETSLIVHHGLVHAWLTIAEMPESRKDLKRIKILLDEKMN